MIILDPDLDPDPSPKKKPAKPSVASTLTAPKSASRNMELPSARTLARFLSAAQTAVRLRGQVTVLLTTDAAIRKLNHQFRGKNKPTDVLSFPAEGLGAQGIAGDLAISVTTALSQAAEQGHSLATEIKVLVLHGLLHLAGYDHEIDNGKMARRERQLRAKLRLPQGLIERTEASASRALKGHGFSRAVRSLKNTGALAPEGSSSGISAVLGESRPSPASPSKSAPKVKRP
jgi:probable rRNA maturation factor